VHWGRRLGTGERWRLADAAHLLPRQAPLALLVDDDQRGAQLRVDGIAWKGRLLGEAANQDGGLVVHAHPDFIRM